MKKPRPADTFLSAAVLTALAGIRRGKGGPFGAVVVRKGKIIARACNTVLHTNNPTRHAEVNAIGLASKRLKRFSLHDCDIYSTTEPCPMCFAAIHWARCRSIVYSTTIGDVKKLGFNELAVSNEKLKALGKTKVKLAKISHQGCRDLLSAWKALSKKSTY